MAPASAMPTAATVGPSASAASAQGAKSPAAGPLTAVVMKCAVAIAPAMIVSTIPVTVVSGVPPDVAIPTRAVVVCDRPAPG